MEYFWVSSPTVEMQCYLCDLVYSLRYIVRSTENSDEKGGSFDASGAFHGPGWSDEEESTAEGRGCGPGRPRQKSSSPDKGTLPTESSGTDKTEGGKNQDDSEAAEDKPQKNGVEEPQSRLSPMNGMDPAQSLHPAVDSLPTEVHFFKIYVGYFTLIHPSFVQISKSHSDIHEILVFEFV